MYLGGPAVYRIDIQRSVSLLAVVCKILLTSSSNCSHKVWLFAGGHLIRFCGTILQGLEGSSAWRDRALWGDSWPGSSCVSPGSDLVRCTSLSCSMHFILAWCILRLRGFLHTLSQIHLTFVIVMPFAWVDNLVSDLLGFSFSPTLGLPWGYFWTEV